MGAITPLGHTAAGAVRQPARGAVRGRADLPVRRPHLPDHVRLPGQGLRPGPARPRRRSGSRTAGLNTQFALAAAKQALADAGLLDNPKVDRTRIGIYLGSGEGSHDFPEPDPEPGPRPARPTGTRSTRPPFYKHSLATFRAAHEYELEMHTTSGHVAAEYDLQGVNYTCQTACAASGQAVGEALELIRRGDADGRPDRRVAQHDPPVRRHRVQPAHGPVACGTTSRRGPAGPFDLNRDGFVLGEGAGMVVLEELEHAKRRGAPIYAELAGYGTTADAYRVTDSHPDGRGAIACIRLALAGRRAEADGHRLRQRPRDEHAGQRPGRDARHQGGLRRVRLPGCRSRSSKSMLGHLIAAAGVVELITCVLTIRNGVLVRRPSTTRRPDPDCDLDYVPNTAAREEGRPVPVEQLRVRRAERLADRQPVRGLTPVGVRTSPRRQHGWGARPVLALRACPRGSTRRGLAVPAGRPAAAPAARPRR